MITVIQQCWTGMFSESIYWQTRDIDADEILSIEPKEIYIEDLTLASHFAHDSKFLKALGATIVTSRGNIVTLQSPDEIYQLTHQENSSSDISDFDAYLDMKARSYPENDWILSERDRQTRAIEKTNKIIKSCCLFLLATFLIFSLIYPQKSYELVRDMLSTGSNLMTELTRMIFSNYM